VDRARAAEFNADITIVGNTVQLVTNGMKIGEYRPDDTDDEIDIRVRYPVQYRSLEQIDKLRVPSGQGMVPMGTFVSRMPVQKVGTISRSDMRRVLDVKAELAPGVLADDMVKQIRELIPSLDLGPKVDITFKGEDRDQREAMAFLEKALVIAVFVIAIILVTQFNSLFQAFLILTAVLFSIGGVLISLMLRGMPFGIIMSGVGVIALAGIVVNNNIVLIDTYNYLRKAGYEAREAILRTCAQRLRPVMLTTVTTILGLMPMVLGLNLDLINRDLTIGAPASQFWIQLSTVVAGGLAFSTVITLLLTPSLLWWQQSLSQNIHDRITQTAQAAGTSQAN
jgi:multidrug efflux pump